MTDALTFGFLGTRHVHSHGIATILKQMGHSVVGAVEDDAAARAEWEKAGYSPLADVETVLAGSDAIIVCGTNRERAADAARALDAELPVLCEKPIGLAHDQVAMLRDKVQGRKFMTALPVRFSNA